MAESFGDAVVRVKRRLHLLNPTAIGPLPLLVDGSGRRIAPRITAEHADMWKTMLEKFEASYKTLDEWRSGWDAIRRRSTRPVSSWSWLVGGCLTNCSPLEHGMIRQLHDSFATVVNNLLRYAGTADLAVRVR